MMCAAHIYESMPCLLPSGQLRAEKKAATLEAIEVAAQQDGANRGRLV